MMVTGQHPHEIWYSNTFLSLGSEFSTAYVWLTAYAQYSLCECSYSYLRVWLALVLCGCCNHLAGTAYGHTRWLLSSKSCGCHGMLWTFINFLFPWLYIYFLSFFKKMKKHVTIIHDMSHDIMSQDTWQSMWS